MEDPKISIIVPCYNVEKYVSKCLDSIVNQTFRDIEIIVVNDGSQDGTLDILRKYESKDRRIIVIDQQNQGLSGARNSAINKALGEFIVLLDGDDWMDIETCEVAYDTALKNSADVVMWSYVREYDKVSLPKVIFDKDIVFDEKQCKNLHRRFIGLINDELSNPENFDSIVTAWGKMYRRQIIIDNQLQFIDLKKIGTFEDGFFNLEYFAFVKKAVFLNRCFNHYLKSNTTALTKSYKSKLFEHYKNLFCLMKDYIGKNNLSDDFKKALGNRICYSLIGIGLTECLPNNPKSKTGKIVFLKQVLNDPIYKKALQELSIRYFPLHWKVFYGFAKMKFASGVFFLLVVINKIINR